MTGIRCFVKSRRFRPEAPGFSPMHRLLSTIVAVSMMLHATFGCCFHHAHSCETNCCDVPAAIASSCGCDSYGHGEQRSPRNSENSNITQQTQHSEHHDEHECEGESCSFANTVESPQIELISLQNFVCVFDVAALAPQVTSHGLSLHRPIALNAARSNLRLHLLLDVLLI